VTSEVEERIHNALARHPLERIEQGYRLVHPQQAGISTLRLLPVNGAGAGPRVVSIAEVAAEYDSGLPSFHATGVQRLNSWAVHSAYHQSGGRLRQTAQFSIYADEPAVHLATQSILNAFGGQLPLGRSIALAIAQRPCGRNFRSAVIVLRDRLIHRRRPRCCKSMWEFPIRSRAPGIWQPFPCR
jgi:hypothetical protein